MSRGVSAAAALQKLREGNARFAAHARGTETLLTAERRAKLTAVQEPFAIVLGHSSCGAIAATIEELHRPTTNQSPNQRAIVDRIRPGVEKLVALHEAEGALAIEHAAMSANVRASVDQLRQGSAIIEDLIASDGLVVTGAWYSLETGKVEFLEETLPA